MTRFGSDSLATVEFTLKWHDREASHEEWFLGRRVNAWRDIFPPGLKKALKGGRAGDSVSVEYGPDEVIPPYAASNIMTIPAKFLNLPMVAGRAVQPTVDRYYPQGALEGLPNIYPQNSVPFRLLEKTDETVCVDCNHPLAGRMISLSATIQTVQEKRSDTGATLAHWIEEIGNYGPGMQAPLPDIPLAVDEAFFSRLDTGDDARFYADPRLVPHIDGQASHNLQRAYARFLKPGMRVLDLMSSHQSHLPTDLNLDVMGLGLNVEEMANNSRLSGWVVHDLNRSPVSDVLPPIARFDAVVCSLSVEYLVDPVATLDAVRQFMPPGSVMLVGFSDRWFPTKAITGWMDLHPFERPGVVLEWLREAGFQGSAGSMSFRNDWRPREDRHFMETRGVSDPVFVAWAYND